MQVNQTNDSAKSEYENALKTIKEIVQRVYDRVCFVDAAIPDFFDADSTLNTAVLSEEQVRNIRIAQASNAAVIDMRMIKEYIARLENLGPIPVGQELQALPAAVSPEPTPAPLVAATAAMAEAAKNVPPQRQTAPPPRRQVPQRPAVVTAEQQSLNEEKMRALQQVAAEQAEQQRQARERAAEQARQRQEAEQAAAAQEQQRMQELVQQHQHVQEAPGQIAAPAKTPIKPKPQPTKVTATARVLTAYERLMLPDVSPLTHMFAPSPWFPMGQGEITVGSEEKFGKWFEKTTVDVTDFNNAVRLPSGFYGKTENGPQFAVIRLNTCVAVWNFGFGPEDVYIFHSVMNPTPADLVFRPICACASSAVRRFLIEIGEVYGIKRDAMVIES